MFELKNEIEAWISGGHEIALATVVRTWGSSPRAAGAKMAIRGDGAFVGSVSGGCVEGALIETGLDVLKTSVPQLLHFGVTDETAWEVGLACGGEIDVFVQRIENASYTKTIEALRSESSIAITTIVKGPDSLVGQQIFLLDDGAFKSPDTILFEPSTLNEINRLINEGISTVIQGTTSDADPVELFVDVITPPSTLVIIGGAHISVALAQVAKHMGYRTVLIDPRQAFAKEERFSDVDARITAWPQDALKELSLTPSTAVAVLTHDPKIDDPALLIALRSSAFYIGALGSRKTQAARRIRLKEGGLSEKEVDRLRGPIGLDIGASAPEEIGLAIMAEIIAVRRGRGGETITL